MASSNSMDSSNHGSDTPMTSVHVLKQGSGANTSQIQLITESSGKVAAPKHASPEFYSVIKTPAQAFAYFVHTAETKQATHIWKLIWLGILAGFYIGLGYVLVSAIAGQLPHDFKHDYHGIFNLLYGAFGLPVGLTMVVLTGVDLFTSNIAYMTSGLLEGKTGLFALLRSWFISWFSNLLGALILVWTMNATDVFSASSEGTDFVIELAYKKTHYTWGAAFVRGIMCNFCVCMAVFQAALAQDLTGKFVGVFLPIFTFMAIGMEHSIANQYIISQGYALQGMPTCTEATPDSLLTLNPAACQLTIGRIVGNNLIPVTLGNIIGGGVLVAIALGVPNGRVGKAFDRLHEKYFTCCKGAAWRTWPVKSQKLPV